MQLHAELETLLGCNITELRPRADGDAAQAFDVLTADGTTLFCKTVSSGSPFFMEARGLELLKTSGGVRVPEVIAVNERFLVLERITFGTPANGFQEELGRRLALTHQALPHNAFGFEDDHWIGATPQQNLPWVPFRPGARAEFFWTHRLAPMLERLDDPTLLQAGHTLEGRLPELLAPAEEKPCLIHGDLWSGNVGADQTGHPVIFDPAPAYAPREAELGMTKLFGGFSPAFYASYHETFPLKEGWQERQDLFMLYHVLNHAVLFGGGYRGQALALMKRYV